MRLISLSSLLSPLAGSALILALALHAGAARAIDSSQIKIIGEHWSVVGVIAGADNADTAKPATGIAVLRSNITQRTYTLSIGDSVPTEFGFVLKSVGAHSVVIASQETAITLSFSEPPVETADVATATPESRSSRFLENYYRGFESEGTGDEAGDDDDSGAPATIMVPHLGRMRADAAARLAPLRARTYRLDEDDETGGFVVNFDDEDDGDGRGSN